MKLMFRWSPHHLFPQPVCDVVITCVQQPRRRLVTADLAPIRCHLPQFFGCTMKSIKSQCAYSHFYRSCSIDWTHRKPENRSLRDSEVGLFSLFYHNKFQNLSLWRKQNRAEMFSPRSEAFKSVFCTCSRRIIIFVISVRNRMWFWRMWKRIPSGLWKWWTNVQKQIFIESLNLWT